MITATQANKLANEKVGESVKHTLDIIESAILYECGNGCKCAFVEQPEVQIRSLVRDELVKNGFQVEDNPLIGFNVWRIRW